MTVASGPSPTAARHGFTSTATRTRRETGSMNATRSIGALRGQWPLPGVPTRAAAPDEVLDEEPTDGGSDGEIESWRDELTGRAREHARGARAESTWAAYDSKWARSNRWCAEHDQTSLPADPLTVARFLTDLAPHWRPA